MSGDSSDNSTHISRLGESPIDPRGKAITCIQRP